LEPSVELIQYLRRLLKTSNFHFCRTPSRFRDFTTPLESSRWGSPNRKRARKKAGPRCTLVQVGDPDNVGEGVFFPRKGVARTEVVSIPIATNIDSQGPRDRAAESPVRREKTSWKECSSRRLKGLTSGASGGRQFNQINNFLLFSLICGIKTGRSLERTNENNRALEARRI
jgi:hypothetical protein